MKIVGIIGGLGPETTTKFYMDIVFACSKISGQRPNMLISNVGVPLEVEKDIITKAKNERKILPLLVNSAKQLEKGGANFIVIPCNTVHIFTKEIRNVVKIPVLSIIEETATFLKKEKITKIGLFATTATIKNKLFDKNLNQNGIQIKIPNATIQLKMSDIIHHLVNGKATNQDKNEFLKIVDTLKINNAVLACTDLQLLKPKHDNVKFFDTMKILAQATVRQILI